MWYSCCLSIIIFAIEKAKTAKNIINKKDATIASIAAPVLQFL